MEEGKDTLDLVRCDVLTIDFHLVIIYVVEPLIAMHFGTVS